MVSRGCVLGQHWRILERHACCTELVLPFFQAHSLAKAHVGFWSALTYLTLPAVSVSSIIISTDAFLLFFWGLALLSVIKIIDRASSWWWGVLSIGLGFGLLSKYAMAFFSFRWLFLESGSSRGVAT